MDQKQFDEIMARRKARNTTTTPSNESGRMGIVEETLRGMGRAPISIITAPVEGLDLVSKLGMRAASGVSSAFTGEDPNKTYQETLKSKQGSIISPLHYTKKILDIADQAKQSGILKPSDAASKGWREGIKDPNWWASNISEAATFSGILAKGAKDAIKKQGAKYLETLSSDVASETAKKYAKDQIRKIGARSVIGQSATVGGAMSHGQYRNWEKENPESATVVGDLVSSFGGAAAGSLEGVAIGSHMIAPFIKKFGRDTGTKVATSFFKEMVKAAPKHMAVESTTEGIQSLIENTAVKLGYDQDKDLLDGVMESMIIGGAVGAGFGAFEASSGKSGKSQEESDLIKLIKSRDKIAKIKEGISEQNDILSKFEEGTPEHDKALVQLKKFEGDLAKHEGFVDSVSKSLGNGKVSDADAFGTTVDPSLTIEEVAKGVDSGNITKEQWNNTDKSLYSKEEISLVDQHLEDYENIIKIDKLSKGEDITEPIKTDVVDGSNKNIKWSELPENFTNDDAVSAINNDLKLWMGDKAPNVTTSKSENSEVVDQLSEILGVKTVKVSIDSKSGNSFNGIVLPKNNKVIFLNDQSKRPEIWILGHEFSHSLESTNKEAYKYLFDVAASEVDPNEIKKYRDFLDKLHGVNPGTTTPQTALKEMMGDFVGDKFSDKEFWNKLYNNNPSKFKQIITAVKDYISNILSKFSGTSAKSDKFFKDMVKIENTLVDVMNEHIGYTGAVNKLVEGEVQTGTVTDLNANNKHWTNVKLGEESNLTLREDKNTIYLKRLARPGSRRGTEYSTTASSKDKGIPTAALNELKKYATETGKTIVAETGRVHPYLTSHGFVESGRDMEWKPGSVEAVTTEKAKEATPLAEGLSPEVTEGFTYSDYSKAKEKLTEAISGLDEKISNKHNDYVASEIRTFTAEKSNLEAQLKELNKDRAKRVKFAENEILNSKNEILDLNKKIEDENKVIHTSTSRDALLFAKEQIDKYSSRIEELNGIIDKYSVVLKPEETQNDQKSGQEIRGNGQQGAESIGSTPDTGKSQETDSGNRDQQSPTEIPKLTDKIEEVKKEQEYKKIGGVEGKLKKLTDTLAKEGKRGDVVAFVEAIQKEGIDVKTASAEVAYQEAFRRHMMSEENDPAPVISKKEAKKEGTKTKKKRKEKYTKEERIKLNVLTAMLSQPKVGKEELVLPEEYETTASKFVKDYEEDVAFNDDIVGELKFSADPIDPKDPNPEVQKKIEQNQKMSKRDAFRTIKDWITATYKTFTSPIAELRPGKYGFLKDRIRLAKEVDKFGSRQAFGKIYSVIGSLNEDEKQVFTMNLILSDILKDTMPNDQGVAILVDGHLPFGYKTVDQVRESLRHFREQAKKSPKVMTALANRRKMMLEIQDQLIEAGFLPKELKGNDAYFHHQTIEKLAYGDDYMFGMQKRAGDKKLGWTRERSGEIADYSTDYIVSEFSVVSNAIATLELNKIKKQLKERYDITRSLKEKFRGGIIEIPKRFVKWSPSQYTGWGASPTYPDAIMENVLQQAKIDPNIKDQMRIASGNKEAWIIPERMANALSRVRETRHQPMPAKISNALTQAWKKWMLINPLRVIRYNINNMSGDADIAMAYDYKIFKYAPQAMRDLAGDIKSTGMKLPFGAHNLGTNLSDAAKKEIEEAHRLGVIGAGFVMHEIADVSQEFEDIMRGPQGNIISKNWKKWWQGSKDITNYRENILRLASYRYFKDRLAKGEKHVYGASNPSEIDEITDINEKAAKLSRELIGDYGRLSEGGEWMRKHLIPFYSWMEINAPRYVRMMRNLKVEGKDTKSAIASSLTWKSSVLGAKFMMFTGMVSLWNNILFGDDEDKLQGYQKRNMHLLLGKRDDGSIRYLPISGAFRDALSWFGGEDAYYDITDMTSGDVTPMEKLKEAGVATPSKLFGGARPFTKLAFETVTGVSTFPDITNPRPIRDKFDYVAKSMSLELMYRWAAGKPTKGVAEEFGSKLFYNVDPGESAYYAIKDKIRRFNKRLGHDHKFSAPTDKANALYYYKQSLRYADLELAEKYLKEYIDLGGNAKGLKSSYTMSMPTAGLRKEDKGKFYASLTDKDKELLNLASKWYRQTYTNLAKKH